MIDDALFLTGTQRSGTTLLEKLVGAWTGVSMLSQPFPLLFVEIKRAFLRSRGLDDDPYPLGPLFHETRYSKSELAAFLREWRPSRRELEALFAQMRDYSGQYTKFASDQLNAAFDRISQESDFADVVSRLDHSLAHVDEARWFGSKETICEEFVPFLLERGFRCAIIVRDPRDVAASLNSRRGVEFGGSVKPTLNNVRSWRKSVAYAIAMEKRPRFHWCRYEDLASHPAHVLSRLASDLGIDTDPAQIAPVGIVDAQGIPWRGNSSYGERTGVSTESIGAWREALPGQVSEMIEATCLPELQLLGYETTLTRAEAARVIARFREPYEITRRGMEQDAATPENAELEQRRLDRVTEPSGSDSESWFVFAEMHDRLREAFRP